MTTGIVAQADVGMSALARQRKLDDLVLRLKGLVHVRALLETHGASAAEIAAHSDEIDRVRDELARFAKLDAHARADYR